jgi:hypothetical protein
MPDKLECKQVLKQLPAALRTHLRSANIQDSDVASVTRKLQERLSCNVLSYLQLCILKLRPDLCANTSGVLRAHDARKKFTATLEDHITGS